jgi:hypothetical protein
MSAEEIIILKQYFELSSSELDQVSAYATNKVDFDDMKAFLLDTKNVFESEKITTSKSLDKDIMVHLHASTANRQVWYNSVWLFLFPEGKQFYRVPAFQMAFTAVIGFGIFGLINISSLNPDTMAFEEVADKVEISPFAAEEIVDETNFDGEVNLEEPVVLADKKLGYYKGNVDHLIEESPLMLKDVVVSDDVGFYYAIIEEESVEMEAPVFALSSSVGSIEKEKDFTNDISREVVELKEQDDKVTDLYAITTTNEELTNTKNKEYKDSRRDKFKKKNSTKKIKNTVTPVMSEVSSTEGVKEYDVEEKAEVNLVRNNNTVKQTQELIQLFFEVK